MSYIGLGRFHLMTEGEYVELQSVNTEAAHNALVDMSEV